MLFPRETANPCHVDFSACREISAELTPSARGCTRRPYTAQTIYATFCCQMVQGNESQSLLLMINWFSLIILMLLHQQLC